jgi:hypothetical protein
VRVSPFALAGQGLLCAVVATGLSLAALVLVA